MNNDNTNRNQIPENFKPVSDRNRVEFLQELTDLFFETEEGEVHAEFLEKFSKLSMDERTIVKFTIWFSLTLDSIETEEKQAKFVEITENFLIAMRDEKLAKNEKAEVKN